MRIRRFLTALFLTAAVVAAAAPAWSQDKKLNFSLNAGVQTNLSDLAFPQTGAFGEAWLTLDARVGVSLGPSTTSWGPGSRSDTGFDKTGPGSSVWLRP